MPNYTSKLFEGVQKKNVKKSFQDLSHEWNHDIQPGYLTPFLMVPTLPGDEFTKVKCEFFFKFDPLYYPIIHRMKLEADLYYVPNRIMWPEVPGDFSTGWTNWIMLRDEFSHPTIDVNMADLESGGNGNNSVMGYFGIPYLWNGGGSELDRTVVITGLNAFPAMAYILIWDQYYRNPSLEETRGFPLVAGDNTAAMIDAYGFLTPTDVRLNCLPGKWDMDYFTAGLPRPQAGEAVKIPQISAHLDPNGATNYSIIRKSDGSLPTGTDALSSISGNLNAGIEGESYVDNTNVAPTMREFTLAQVLQGLRESLLKIGQRYQDYIKGIFDEDPTPMDINVPVLFGTYKATVNISEVMSQASTDGELGIRLGDYGGNMALYDQDGGVHKIRTSEHGLLIGIMCLKPTTRYGQGINRYWRYSTPYDYPMDVFCGIGDQEVLHEELYFDNLTAVMADHNGKTFNYIPRYSEARTILNNYGTNLASKVGYGLSAHLGRWWDPEEMVGTPYDNAMNFNDLFISTRESNDFGGLRIVDVWRTLVLTSGKSASKVVNAYVYNQIEVMRPLPAKSVPGDLMV